MKRLCIDGLVHLAIDIAELGNFRTLCAMLGPGLRLYEHMPVDAPLTCLQCVIFSSSSPDCEASQGASAGQK